MWIKICGLTTAAAVAAALEAQVDALGFVFAPSVRRLAPAVAARLARPARGRAACVAVMRQPSQAEVDEVLAVLRPELLQSEAADFERLRLPAALGRLPVLRAPPLPQQPLPPRALFEGSESGSGRAADWGAAQALARRLELVLAGGLSPANVAAAIHAVAPFGVDVSSGVEERPGVKSPAAIASFVAAAQAAASATTSGGKSR